MCDIDLKILSDGFVINSSGSVSFSSSSLVLDSERGELVDEATEKLQRKENSTITTVRKSMAALRNHCEAERMRRARINGHLDTLRGLIPDAKKMDKATLLTKALHHLKELKKNASEASQGLLIPTDIDGVKIELLQDLSFRASLSCDYLPGLLITLRKALDDFRPTIIITKAEIAIVGGRIVIVFLITSSKKENVKDLEMQRSVAGSIHKALNCVLDSFTASRQFSLKMLSNKRRRISLFESSSSLSSGVAGDHVMSL